MKITEIARSFADRKGPDPTDPVQLLGSYAAPLLRTLRRIPNDLRDDFAQEYWCRTLESAHKHRPAEGRTTCSISHYHKTLMLHARAVARISSTPRPTARTVQAYLKDETLGSDSTQLLIRAGDVTIDDGLLNHLSVSHIERNHARIDIHRALAQLAPRDAAILRMQLAGRDQPTIARRYGLSRQRVSQVVQSSLDLLAMILNPTRRSKCARCEALGASKGSRLDRREKAIALRLAGHTYAEIARQLDCSTSEAHRLAKYCTDCRGKK